MGKQPGVNCKGQFCGGAGCEATRGARKGNSRPAIYRRGEDFFCKEHQPPRETNEYTDGLVNGYIPVDTEGIIVNVITRPSTKGLVTGSWGVVTIINSHGVKLAPSLHWQLHLDGG